MKKNSEIDLLFRQAVAAAPSKTEKRRALILQTVVNLLATEGVDSLTFESVGKAANMARSHVVYYYANREELVVAAIRFAALSAAHIIEAEIERGRNTGKSWKGALRGYIEGNFEWIRRYPLHANVYTLLYYLASLHPTYRSLHTEIRQAGTERIIGLLELGPPRGKKTTRVLAKAIQGLITGNLIDVMTTNLKNNFEERRRETLDVIENWLDAY